MIMSGAREELKLEEKKKKSKEKTRKAAAGSAWQRTGSKMEQSLAERSGDWRAESTSAETAPTPSSHIYGSLRLSAVVPVHTSDHLRYVALAHLALHCMEVMTLADLQRLSRIQLHGLQESASGRHSGGVTAGDHQQTQLRRLTQAAGSSGIDTGSRKHVHSKGACPR